MDWITQSKFKNWLVVVLLATNLVAVSIIWMQTAKTDRVEPKGQQQRGSESVQLMRKALGLTEEQTRRLEIFRNARAEQSRIYNDRLTVLKRRLAEEVFKEVPDTTLARTRAKEIGELQANVEIIRFAYFNELLALCTPEQRQKLKPIVVEVFGRKPPKDESGENSQPRDFGKERNSSDRPPREAPGNGSSDREGERPQPPSLDERLEKYSQRLNLTDVQRQEIRSILQAAIRKGEQLRKRPNPDRAEIQAGKERIRKEEDEGIMKLLDDNQKIEFEKMISKRREASPK
jgi:Spy/CpxP family protein refolding chaperone